MTDGVPDTFFPSSMPFTTRDGYTIQVRGMLEGEGLPATQQVQSSTCLECLGGCR
jgi:hypothetical protein